MGIKSTWATTPKSIPVEPDARTMADEAWATAQERLRTLQAEAKELPEKLATASSREIQGLINRQQALPQLLLNAQIEERSAYLEVMDAQKADIAEELATLAPPIADLREKIQELQKELGPLLAKQNSLDSQAKSLSQQGRMVSVKIQNMRGDVAEYGRSLGAPVVRSSWQVRR